MFRLDGANRAHWHRAMPVKSTFVLVYKASVAVLFLGACSGDTGGALREDDAGISVGGLSSAGSSSSTAGSNSVGGFSGLGGARDSGGTFATGGSLSGGGTFATGGSSSPGGTIVTGGKIGTGGTLATGGSSSVACPSKAPAASSPCTSTNLSCFYEDCAGAGRTQATCGSNGTWSVDTAACGTVTCSNYGVISPTTCQPGQYCRITYAGASYAMCVTSTCGQGPVTDSCLSSYSCSVSKSLTGGIIVSCNGCPAGSGGCA